MIELDILIEGLWFCVYCFNFLRFEWCVSERKYGLVFIFYIKCLECNGISLVYMGKKYNIVNKFGFVKCFDVNIKFVVGKWVLWLDLNI